MINFFEKNSRKIIFGILILSALFLFINFSQLPSTEKSPLIEKSVFQKERELFKIEDNKILASNIQELTNEQICVNMEYLFVSYCGSGGCFMDDSLMNWINKAGRFLESRGVSYKDMNCSEAVKNRIDAIYQKAKSL